MVVHGGLKSGYELPVFVHGGGLNIEYEHLVQVYGGLNSGYEFPVFAHGGSTEDMNFLCVLMKAGQQWI